MATRKHLIIGAGPAALSALEEIRRITSEDEIKLVTIEDCPLYFPAILPYLLSGKITEARMWVRDENYFKKLRSTLVRNKEATQILPEKRMVIYHDGSSENYDTLLIASGSEPVKPQIRGLEEVGVHNFRTIADCRRLLREVEDRKNVAILGAGIVGMKIAAALLDKGCQVTIIEKEQSVLPSYFNGEAEVYIRDIFVEHGAHFFTGKEVTFVERRNKEIRITLSDGSLLDVGILINATGVKSRVSFLRGTEVRISNGILVDRRMRTGVDRIYAAGDVAEAHDFFSDITKVNAIIPSAITQGRVAGANMLYHDAEYEGGIPMVAFNFFGNDAFSIGLIMPQGNNGQVLKQKDDQKGTFKKLVFDGDKLVGGIFVNEKVDPGIILYLIRNRMDISPYKEALFEWTKPLSNPWLRSLKLESVDIGNNIRDCI